MKPIAHLPLLTLLPFALSLGQDIGWIDLDFEDGREPWGVWYSDDPDYSGPRFEYGPDTSAAKSGEASMRIIATNRDACAFVHQTTDRFKGGARYKLSYWLKVSDPDMASTCVVNINLRKPRKDGKGLTMRGIRPITLTTPGENGWVLRRACFTVDDDTKLVQIGLYVRDTVGTAWFDDVRVREWREGDVSVDSMYDYFPLQVKLGRDMVRRFQKLADGKSPFLDRAKVYNRLLVNVARLTDDVRRFERCARYLDGLGVSCSTWDAATAANEIEDELDGLYRTYGRLFLAKDDAGLVDFDRAAKTLTDSVAATRAAIAQHTESLQSTARRAGHTWSAPPEPQPKPIVILPNGRPNQIVFATRSPGSHFELEEPLTINRLHSVSAQYDMSRLDDPNKEPTFEVTWMLWQRLKNRGVEQASIGTAFAVHNHQMTPKWFAEKLDENPDLLLRAADDAKLKSWRKYSPPLNTWHPDVRKMTVDLATQLGRAFRPHRQFLWYVTAAENLGPYFSVERGVRSTGYNPSALSDFHAWLKQRYRDVPELNRQWKTDYARIEEVQPPDDPCIVGEWKRPHPLGYEFQSWRNDRHVAWQKLIYDALKQADPTKPVFASHSCLLRSLDGSRLFDTADIMGYHTSAPTFMLGTLYVHSLNRFAKKQLGQYECFWGIQEEHSRLAEEKVQRAAMMKYLYRLTVWGRHIQVWWYAYTSADYLLKYNGNWFNPVYDLTTLRYCASALPVGKSKVKRLEEILLNSTIVPSRVVMLQPNTSMLFQRYGRSESFLEMLELHVLLFPRNDLYELIPETYFADGRASFGDFDVVIMPYAPFFPDGLGDLLRGWIRRGGLLIATGPFGLYDKFGFDRPDLWSAVFGPRSARRLSEARDTDWHWDLAGQHLLEGSLGDGKVVVTSRSLRNVAFRDRVSAAIVQAIEAKAPPLARCDSDHFEMTVHQAADGKQYLCVMNRNVDEHVSDRVVLTGTFKRGTDLDVPGGFAISFVTANGRTTFTLSLAPAEFTMIALEE